MNLIIMWMFIEFLPKPGTMLSILHAFKFSNNYFILFKFCKEDSKLSKVDSFPKRI